MWQYNALTYSFPNLELVYFSMSSSNYSFFTCIQVSHEAGEVVWYSHLLKNLPQCVVTHSQKLSVQLSSVQTLSHDWLFATPWIAARQASLSIINSRSSLRFTSIESVMPSSHLILCRPLLLLPPIPPSIRVFSNESTLRMRWSKYWSFNFSIIPSKEIPGLN